MVSEPAESDSGEIPDPADAVEESDGPQHRRFHIEEDVRQRLDRYLCRELPGLSRSRLQKLINEGAVSVNSKLPKNSTVLRAGDVIDVLVPPPTIKQILAEDIPLDILYEDEHLIVLNKQAGLIVHPARSNLSGTMLNALAWHFRDTHANGLEALSSVGVDEFRPGIVHRLDKDTTGAIVVAKTDEAHWRLGRQFEKRSVQKYYLAVVHGEMSPPGGVIDEPIGKHPQVTEAYAVRHDPAARASVTLYRVREVFQGYTLVELELKTGRTHQIRVHLTWMGFPIVSDIVYGGEPVGEKEMLTPPRAAGANPLSAYARQKEDGLKIWNRMDGRPDLLLRRPALHAAVLQFHHPATNQIMRFTAPLAPDMRTLIGELRRRRPAGGELPTEGTSVNLPEVLGPGVG